MTMHQDDESFQQEKSLSKQDLSYFFCSVWTKLHNTLLKSFEMICANYKTNFPHEQRGLCRINNRGKFEASAEKRARIG